MRPIGIRHAGHDTVIPRQRAGIAGQCPLQRISSHEAGIERVEQALRRERIAGKRTVEIEAILGYRGRDEMIHRDDLILTGNGT